jgi:hypothetical protein
LLSRNKEAEPAGKDKDDNSPKLATDLAKDKDVGDEEKENENKSSMYLIVYVSPNAAHDSKATLHVYCVYLDGPVF